VLAARSDRRPANAPPRAAPGFEGRLCWLARHPNVRFPFALTHARWLEPIEGWLRILSARALRGASSASPIQVREPIDAFVEAYNETATPFE
jgi:hypothetical protein